MRIIDSEKVKIYQAHNVAMREITLDKAEINRLSEFSDSYAYYNDGIFPFIYVTRTGYIRDITVTGNKVNYLCMMDELVTFPDYIVDGFGLDQIVYHIIWK